MTDVMEKNENVDDLLTTSVCGLMVEFGAFGAQNKTAASYSCD